MSELGNHHSGSAEASFRPRTLLLLLGVGIASFVALLLLGAYAPDLRSSRNGGSHALSTAATGYAALVELARATGRNPRIARSEAALATEDLVVITPDSGPDDISGALAGRGTKATLVVFPKWNTQPDRGHTGWVRLSGLRPPWDPEQTLAPGWPLRISRHREAGKALKAGPNYYGKTLNFTAPEILQTVAGDKLKPIVTDSAGAAVVAQLGDGPLYILADPDLLSNAGLATVEQARSALDLLDFLNSTDAKGIVFDVTVNGLGRSKSPLKLLFDPPFLSATLAIAAALVLVAIYAVRRFGAPRRPQRALAFGKAALVDNTAALVAKARREAALGARYAAVVRDRALERQRAPRGMDVASAEAWLDTFGGGTRFSLLAREAEGAADRHQLLRAARALHKWEKEIKG